MTTSAFIEEMIELFTQSCERNPGLYDLYDYHGGLEDWMAAHGHVEPEDEDIARPADWTLGSIAA